LDTITTLDGKFWNKQELLGKMDNDDFYFGYLGSNVLSSSSCSDLLKSPKRYTDNLNKPHKPTPQQRIGSMVHYMILEPEKWDAQKDTFKDTEKALAQELAYCILDNSKCLDMIRNARTEVPAVADLYGLPFRGKADILGPSYIVDLKTTSGDLKKFKWKARDFNYDMQMYIYCSLFNISYKDFTFLVIDKQSTSIGIFECSKDFYKSGRQKTLDAVNIYKSFFVDKKKRIEEFYTYGVL
tara:strand:+ start:502 stop:1221 length:720 start_codon:yes stop_codon:yes gene_type:complete